MKRYIGITGRAGSGKTTVAQHLRDRFLYHIYNFSDPIKDMLAQLPQLHRDIWEDRVHKEVPLLLYDRSPRHFAQTLGTEWGRDMIHPDIWILVAEARLQTLRNDYVVFADVRYQNELDWLYKNDGVLIEIVRPLHYLVRSHSSENFNFRYQPNQSLRLENNGSLEQLLKTVNEYHNLASIYWDARAAREQ